MDIRESLKGQYHAALAMLRECVAKCPEDLWLAGTHPRNTWRIAYHATYFTHLYLGTDQKSFVKWKKGKVRTADLWGKPPIAPPFTRDEILEYIDLVVSLVDSSLDAMDLSANPCGFSYYPTLPKLDHQILNIRHLGGHVGQLSELLMARGIYVTWVTEKS